MILIQLRRFSSLFNADPFTSIQKVTYYRMTTANLNYSFILTKVHKTQGAFNY